MYWDTDLPGNRQYYLHSRHYQNQTIEYLQTGINHLGPNNHQNPNQILMQFHLHNHLLVPDNQIQYQDKHLCHRQLHRHLYLFEKPNIQIHLRPLGLEYFHMNQDNHKFHLSRYLSLFVLGYTHWNPQGHQGK